MYADNPHYRRYARMLIDLHRLIADGKVNSPEAYNLREAMEEPEAHLTEAEQLRLNALSGDLSMFHDHEIVDDEAVEKFRGRLFPQLVQDANDGKKWEQLLEVLRSNQPAFTQPSYIAYFRSRAYEELGEFAVAAAFMDEAARREPSEQNYPALAMQLLIRDGRIDEAYRRAKGFVSDSASPARVVLMAAGAITQMSQVSYSPPDLAKTIQAAIQAITAALSRESSAAVRAVGYINLGLLYELVKDNDRAADAFQTVVTRLEPSLLSLSDAIAAKIALLKSGRSDSMEGRMASEKLAGFSYGPLLMAA